MWVSDYTIDAALLRIFQDDKVYDEGQSILCDELRRAWRRTGYRRSDLDAAVARLERQGCVRRETSDGRELVVLLRSGERRLRSFETLLDDLRHAFARLLVPRPARDAATPGVPQGRRRSDRDAMR